MIKPLLQKLIVAVNGSEQSLSAAMYSIMLAMQYKCELKAVYVVDSATLKQLELSRFFIPEESARYKERLTEDGQKYLEYVKRLAEGKKLKIETELRTGSVWREIVTSADEFGADLIILGGKKADYLVERYKTSSTNSEIIGSANCNVLIVKQGDVDGIFKLA